jgi:hypothetical protein
MAATMSARLAPRAHAEMTVAFFIEPFETDNPCIRKSDWGEGLDFADLPIESAGLSHQVECNIFRYILRNMECKRD